jgi:hypothetical protein
MDAGGCNCPLGQCNCPASARIEVWLSCVTSLDPASELVWLQVPLRASDAARAGFSASDHLCGPSGSYIQHIEQQCGVKVELCGGDHSCDTWCDACRGPIVRDVPENEQM